MSRFGDLVAGNVNPAPTPPPVIEEPPRPEEEIADAVSDDLEDLNKKELEEYGRTIGIELDRRHSKGKLIQELNEFKDSK